MEEELAVVLTSVIVTSSILVWRVRDNVCAQEHTVCVMEEHLGMVLVLVLLRMEAAELRTTVQLIFRQTQAIAGDVAFYARLGLVLVLQFVLTVRAKYNVNQAMCNVQEHLLFAN
jgi:hypothetical protein